MTSIDLCRLLPLGASLAALGFLPSSALAQGGPGGPGGPPTPPQLGPVPTPAGNPTTAEKVVLGKMLFWEEQLSTDNTTACGTCHIPSAQGGDPRSGLATSIHPGVDGQINTADDIHASPGVTRADASDNYMSSDFGFDVQITGRTAPTMLMAAYFPSLFWDGRATSQFLDPETGAISIVNGAALESQAAAPPMSDVEMAHESHDWAALTAKLASAKPMALATNLTPDMVSALSVSPDYPALFSMAFGSPVITADRISRAIAAYERTLIPNQTDFDSWAATGNPNFLTQQELQGFGAFNGPGRCAVCHTPPLFSNGTFRNIGVRPPAEDLGRQDVTGNPLDRGRFKVPTLRSVALRDRFFHNGQESSLAGVLNFYARNGDFNDNKDPVINQIGLPPQARQDIIAFLTGALTDSRVTNELPPFDRPTLHSETPAATHPVVEPGVAGTAVVPRMISTAPCAIGTEGFKIGVAEAAGGARAFLVLSDAATGRPYMQTRGGYTMLGPLARMPIFTLSGGGLTGGFATYHLEIPDVAALSGQQLHAQWWVADPLAAGGFAKSDKVELTLF